MRAALFGGPRSITVGERPDPRDQRAHRRYGPRESPPPVQPLVRTAPIVVSLDLLLLRSGARQRYARQDRQRNTTHISSVNV